MPRIDRFVDPLQHGIDYMKHRVEDMYDTAVPAEKPGFFSRLFSPRQPSYTEQIGSYGARKFGKKVAQAFTGYPSQQHGYGQQHRGYGQQHRGGGLFGYQEEPSFMEHPIDYVENSIFNSTLGPLLFVAWPLTLGLFLSAWAHRQIRNNRAWYDKVTLPTNVPPSWLYDPMWTVALTAMGYAAWLVFEEGGFGNWMSLGVYNLGLTMLFTWPIVFFNFHDNIAAPILATLATFVLAGVSILFYFYSGTASLLMAGATAWVGYMTIVNWQVYNKNAGLSQIGKEKGDWPWSSTATAGATVAPVEAREAKKVR